MRIFLTLICSATLVLPVSNLVSADDPVRESAVPSKSRSQTLQRFVAELVSITPGTAPFPAAVTLNRRTLTAPDAFQISAYETTQELYQLVMGSNPSRWKGPRNSAESMTPSQAVEFCERLTLLLRTEDLIPATASIRLPTDIEWEYACRAGSKTEFCFGTLQEAATLLDQYAWHTGNAAGNDPAVGVLKPNDWGLYDTHGYLWEFVTMAAPPAASDPPLSAMGGSWRDSAMNLTCQSRIEVSEKSVSDAVGFRCVLAR